jgi:glycerol-3-phosphate acyltransferase PlsY
MVTLDVVRTRALDSQEEATMPGIIGSLVLIALIGYLWGSIPAGYWMGKLLRGKDFDIRNYGSHKTGMTNVLRTLGKGPAIIVGVIDISKGIGPALIATLVPFFYSAGWGPTVAAILAFLGHCFPVFIGFRGGRGVLTGGGATLVLSPLIFLIGALTTIITIATTRYVSLGSILGSAAATISGLIFFFVGWIHLPQLVFFLTVPLAVIVIHYDNIGRLLAGTERKIGQKVVIPAETASSTKETANAAKEKHPTGTQGQV